MKGETLSGLSHLAGCGAFLVGGDGACMDISVDGAGNAACPGRGDGETVSVGLAVCPEVRTMPLETLEQAVALSKPVRASCFMSYPEFSATERELRRHGRISSPARTVFPNLMGDVRMIHNYGMDEQSSFALCRRTPAPFNLLASVLDVEL